MNLVSIVGSNAKPKALVNIEFTRAFAFSFVMLCHSISYDG